MINKLVVVGLVSLCLTGCAVSDSVSMGNTFDASQRFSIKKHVSTEKQVLALLGKPSNKYFNNQGEETWEYVSGKSTAKTSFWTGNADGTVKVKKLVIVFNKSNKVENYLYSNSTQPLHYNAPSSVY